MSNLKIIVTRRWPENVMQVKLEHLSNLELEYRQRVPWQQTNFKFTAHVIFCGHPKYDQKHESPNFRQLFALNFKRKTCFITKI